MAWPLVETTPDREFPESLLIDLVCYLRAFGISDLGQWRTLYQIEIYRSNIVDCVVDISEEYHMHSHAVAGCVTICIA